MKSIRLSARSNDTDWAMRFVDEGDYDVLYDEDVRVEKPDGSPLLVLRKRALSEAATQQAWNVLYKLKLISRNRGVAAGKENPVINGVNQSAKGWEVASGIVGNFERTVRMPYCRKCAWNAANPEAFEALMPMTREVNALFRRDVPDRWAVQKSYADRTSPDFVIPETVFTTLTVNKNFRTACHKDAGDLEAGFSCLSVIRQGLFKGANLVLPAWRIAVKLDTYDVVMFDAHEFHGNTQLVKLTPDAQRCSVVYYFREKMIHCGSAAEELARAKNRKPGDRIFEDV